MDRIWTFEGINNNILLVLVLNVFVSWQQWCNEYECLPVYLFTHNTDVHVHITRMLYRLMFVKENYSDPVEGNINLIKLMMDGRFWNKTTQPKIKKGDCFVICNT